MRILAAILAVVFLNAEIPAAEKSGTKPDAKPSAKEKARAAEEAAAFDEREALAKLQAMDIFPDMEMEDSELAMAISAEVERLEAGEPAFFKSPAWPLRAARRVAARLGVKPRTVAEIRRHLAETFKVDAEAFQQIHGIQIVSARLTVAQEALDVTPQLAPRMTPEGFTVDCDGSLLATLGDVTQFERYTDESDADFWKRQRNLLSAVGDARPGQEALQITFEFQSETVTASAKSGERLAISEEGKVSITKIAPAAHVVHATDPVVAPKKPASSPAKTAGAIRVKR